jgi:hypothetical protein
MAFRDHMKGTRAVFIVLVFLTFSSSVVEPRGQDGLGPPLTSVAIAAAIGSDADARTVIAMVLSHAMQPAESSRREFFLASQIRNEWLPTVQRVEFVRLSDDDIAAHLAQCGYYWMIYRVERSDNVVSLWLSQKCGSGTRDYVVSFDGREWRLGPPGTGNDGGGWAPGIGSGFSGRPPGCPCRWVVVKLACDSGPRGLLCIQHTSAEVTISFVAGA